MGGPGSGRYSSNGTGKKKPQIRWNEDIPELPASATAEEVWELGLRFFKGALGKKMSFDGRLKLLEIGVKWISTKPVELESKNIDELKAWRVAALGEEAS